VRETNQLKPKEMYLGKIKAHTIQGKCEESVGKQAEFKLSIDFRKGMFRNSRKYLLRESLLRTVPVVFIVFVTLFRFQ
jgi:hypothetical protein